MGPFIFTIFEIFGIVGILAYYITRSVRAGRLQPALYVAISLLLLFWVESPYSYYTYAVYNPSLPRFPHGLGPINKAYGNLPILTPGGYVAYFIIGGVIGVYVARALARRTSLSWPKALLLGGWLGGFVWDMFFENLGTWLNVFHYERSAPGLAIFPGTIHQFPIYISLSIASQVMLVTYFLGRTTDRGEPALRPAVARRTQRWATAGTLAAMIVVFQIVYLAIMAPNMITKHHGYDTTHISQRVYRKLPNQPL